MPFNILTLEEIELQLLKEKRNLQNFPRTSDFPFPERYEMLVTSMKTIEIASEAILYNSIEAVNENKESEILDYWCFGGNGQGDRWLLDRGGNVFFFDHDDEKLQRMNVDFDQWLQMAFIIHQLDSYFDEYDEIPESIRKGFHDALNDIQSGLSQDYPFMI